MDRSRLVLVLCGLAFVAAGLFPMLDALDAFPGSASRLNAPHWIVFIVGSLFFTCGMWLLLGAVVGEVRARAFGVALGISILLGAIITANWVAFGAGPRDCSGGIAVLGIGMSRDAAEIECRAAFGYGAVLLDLIALRGLFELRPGRNPAGRVARTAAKALEWSIGLLLLPLLLLVSLPNLASTLKDKIAAKLRNRGSDAPPPADPTR